MQPVPSWWSCATTIRLCAEVASEVDLILHVDPTTGKPSGEVDVSKEIADGVAVEVDVQVDQDGKPTVTIGVEIPL